MRECLFFLFAFLICETLSVILPQETDCYNKGFICYDEDRFYQCVDIGNKTVTMGVPQFCPKGLKCSDSDEIECEGQWFVEDLKDISTTTLKSNIQTDVFQEITTSATNTIDEFVSGWNITDQFLEVDNQISNITQTESTSVTEEEEEFVTEFHKLKITTDSVIKIPSLEGNEFLEVQTTKLPTPKDVDESLPGWKEPFPESEVTNEENIYATEVETLTSNVMTDAPEDDDYEYIYDFWNDEVAEETATTIVHGTITTNEEQESITDITLNAKPSTDGLKYHEILLPVAADYDVTTQVEVLESTVKEFQTTPGRIPSIAESENFNCTTEQNEISEITLILETESDETEASVDDVRQTMTQNTIAFQKNYEYTTTVENMLFTSTIASALTEEDSKTFESTDNEDVSTISSTFETIGEFTPSAQTTSDHLEEMKTEDEVFRSDTDTTLLVESYETSRDCTTTTTESDLTSINEQITSTQSESTINSVLNSTEVDVSTNAPTITANTVQDSLTTVTQEENRLHSYDTAAVISTDKEIKFVTTDWYIPEDVDGNQNSQPTLPETNTENTAAETYTLDNVSDTEEKENRDENATEVMTIQTADTSRQNTEAFGEPSTIKETSITPTCNTTTTTSFTSGIYVEDDISLPSITEATTVSTTVESNSNEAREATSLESGTSALESEGLNTSKESILDADISTITVKELDDDIDNSYIHSTFGEVNPTDSSTDQENIQDVYTTPLSDNAASKITETSTYSLLDFYTTGSSSLANTLRGNTESTTDNKEIVEDDNNCTTLDTISTTEIPESSRTTDLPPTLSSEEINTNTKNLVPSTEPEVTNLVTNDLNNTAILVNVSIEIDEVSIIYDKEVSTASLLPNTTEPASSEGNTLEESSLPEVRSTSNGVTEPSSSEVPLIFTTHAEVSEPVPTFTCPSVGKFPDPKSCSKFYLCINAFVKYIPVALECPKGILFDAAVKECTRRPVQCPGETLLTCTTSGVYPHPTDCSRYYKCLWRSFNKNFVLKQFKCPQGTRYYHKNRCCQRTSAAECANSFADDVSFKCVEVGRFAVEESCREYYECKEKSGKMTLNRKTCSESKLFDPEWGRCRKSHLVVCPFGDYDSRDTSEMDDRSVEYG